MQPKPADTFRAMTPAQKLEAAGRLYQAAWELKAAGIRIQHPIWTQEQVADEVRKIFRRAHT